MAGACFYFLVGQLRARPKGARLRVPLNFETNIRARSMRNNNQILHGDQTTGEDNLRSTRMLTRDLFAKTIFC